MMFSWLVLQVVWRLPAELVLRDGRILAIGADYQWRGRALVYDDEDGNRFLLPLVMIDARASFRRAWTPPTAPPPPPPPRPTRVPWDHPAFRDKKADAAKSIEIRDGDLPPSLSSRPVDEQTEEEPPP